MITLDLNTSIVPKNRKVWRFFPGNGYKFVANFEATNRIYLDLPGFECPRGSLRAVKDLQARVLMAQRTGELLREQGVKANINLRVSEFENAPKTANRTRIVNTTIRLFEEVRRRDLIIVPKTLEQAVVLIGEIRSGVGKRVYARFASEYGLIPIPAKRITWLQEVPETKLSMKLSKSLRHEHSLSELPADLSSEVFSIAYVNYAMENEYGSTLFNFSDAYLDRDSSIIGFISQIAAIHSFKASEGLIERNDTRTDFGTDLFTILLNPVPIEFSCHQSTDIHSTGFNRYLSEHVTPLVTASLFSLLAFLGSTSSLDRIEADLSRVRIQNTKSLTRDNCTPIVSAATQSFLDTTDAAKIWQMCVLAREVQERSKVRTGAVVRDGIHPEIRLPEKRF